MELIQSIQLFLTIALGIAFGVALIPTARKALSFLGIVARGAQRVRRSRAFRGAVIGILVVGIAVIALRVLQMRASQQAAAQRLAESSINFTHDSAAACSDSALIVQRNYADSVSRQTMADVFAPGRKDGDSAWLAWKRRRDERERPPSITLFPSLSTCDEFRQAARHRK